MRRTILVGLLAVELAGAAALAYWVARLHFAGRATATLRTMLDKGDPWAAGANGVIGLGLLAVFLIGTLGLAWWVTARMLEDRAKNQPRGFTVEAPTCDGDKRSA